MTFGVFRNILALCVQNTAGNAIWRAARPFASVCSQHSARLSTTQCSVRVPLLLYRLRRLSVLRAITSSCSAKRSKGKANERRDDWAKPRFHTDKYGGIEDWHSHRVEWVQLRQEGQQQQQQQQQQGPPHQVRPPRQFCVNVENFFPPWLWTIVSGALRAFIPSAFVFDKLHDLKSTLGSWSINDQRSTFGSMADLGLFSDC